MNTKFFDLRLGASVVLLCSGAPALSQDWTFSATAYAWLNETDVKVGTPFGSVQGTLSFSDAVENLDFAFMGVFEANYGPWSLLTDVVYTDLSADGSPPFGSAFTSVGIESKMTLVSALAAYRAYNTQEMFVDIGAGLRYVDLENTALFSVGFLPAASSTTTTDWIEPIIAARMGYKFSERTSTNVFVDYGDWGGSSSTWQAIVSIGYQVSDSVDLRAGYRYLELANGSGATRTTIDLSGPIFGVTYNF